MQLGDIPAVFAGGVIYERFPDRLTGALGGKPWVKIDVKAVTGVDPSALGQGQANDPTQGLAFLRGVSGPVREVGHERVRGDDTTHYAVTVDLERAVAQAPADQRAALQTLIDQVGVATLPVDVWIDGDNRVRREHLAYDLSKMHLPNQTTAPTGAIDATIELYDFGVPVVVNVPPPDQVTDLGALLQRAKSGA